MNNEFTNKLAIIPHNQTPSSIESPFSEFDILYANIDIDPQANQKSFSGNQAYEFKLRITFNTVDADIINKYKNGRPLVLLLFDTDDNFYQVGSELTPIFVDINEQKLASEFNFIGKLLASPFSIPEASTVIPDPPYVPPNFDDDKNDKTITALINKSFSLYMRLSNINTSLAQTIYYRITFNDVPEVITVTSGTDLSTVIIQRIYNITSQSYLKIECSTNIDFSTLANVFVYRGIFRIQNASISRFNYVSDNGAGYSYMPDEFDLEINDIPEADINNLLEQFKSTVDDRTTAPLIFDISGGTNAVPTSVNAIAAKNTLIATYGQSYSDNS